MEVGLNQHHGTPTSPIVQQKRPEKQAQAAAENASSPDFKPPFSRAAISKSIVTKKPQLFPSSGNAIHVLMTAGAGAYQGFQSRVMYGTFRIVQREDQGKNLVGFTRILHSINPDELMNEIPTFHATPLQPECDTWCEFPPASRPNAVRQFFDAARKNTSMITAPWLLMTECDYVWIKPLTAPRAEIPSATAIAFPFGYINPTYPTITEVMHRLYPGPLEDIPGTGPAPALMRVSEWLEVTPKWEQLTADIEADPEAKEKLGWVREMYAFAIACALQKVKIDLRLPPENKLMVQPPADKGLGAAALMHYTWGSVITDKKDKEVWKFDKREYTDVKYLLNPDMLPDVPMFDPEAGWKLQDGVMVTPELRDTLNVMMLRMNEAIAALKPLDNDGSG